MASKKGQYQLGIEISGKTNRSLKGAVDSAQGDVERLRRKMYASGRDMERAFSKIDTRGLKALDRAADLTFSGMVKSAKAAAAGISAAVAVSFGYGGSFEYRAGDFPGLPVRNGHVKRGGPGNGPNDAVFRH